LPQTKIPRARTRGILVLGKTFYWNYEPLTAFLKVEPMEIFGALEAFT
jgi:hypothetical protein